MPLGLNDIGGVSLVPSLALAFVFYRPTEDDTMSLREIARRVGMRRPSQRVAVRATARLPCSTCWRSESNNSS
jgi:hypothetical protein